MLPAFQSPAQREDFVAGLPKAELHLHIEGSLEPELMFALAQRNAIDIPFASVEEVRAAYAFSNLQDFLDIYYQGMSVLRTEQDFHDLTMAYFQRVHRDQVRHAEIFFDPQGHTERGVSFDTAISGTLRAMDDAKSDLGISSHLIMCFLRHLSEEDAFATLEQAEPWLDRILGVGLDSSELGHPPSKFVNVFARARDKGLKCVAHAGEEGPPAYVREALDSLKIDRLDHGNRSLEDGELVKRLAEEGMTLTVCPLSNLALCVVDDLRQHPLKKMLDAGLRATINSDDPSYFGGYMNDNFLRTAEALDLTADEIVTLAKNGFSGSFEDAEFQTRALGAIDQYAAEFFKV
ncbi:adenosine deaminase [Parasphingorhabdus marina DSM 22363]|uniref:Adenine deaminase n=1 Tax=Parasphingorhabdus marina DSM 22363 TaxID=1123272 RepID=A0A1N6CTM4_9SPHN|nr:adenosine deaminase [Parasphingorhabdus marina]SIN61978.1 adenosine deaminase [Parasphingorhabdus marina DSM 22363]